MIGLKIDKANFFDRTKVINAIGKAEARNQAKAGAHVRTTARRSMKKVGKRARAKGETSSKPGNPPFVHKGTLKDLIYFAYEPSKQNTVIGPEGIGGSDTPSVLEYGGTTVRMIRPDFQKRKPRKTTPKQVEAFKRKLAANSLPKRLPKIAQAVNYAARPFMGPALEKSQDFIASVWKDSVKP